MTLPIWVRPPRQAIRSSARSSARVARPIARPGIRWSHGSRRAARRARRPPPPREHVGLQRAGEVPGGLPAHGRVEREDQPPAPALASVFRLRTWAEEGVDLGSGGVAPARPRCERASRGSLAMGHFFSKLRQAINPPPYRWTLHRLRTMPVSRMGSLAWLVGQLTREDRLYGRRRRRLADEHTSPAP